MRVAFLAALALIVGIRFWLSRRQERSVLAHRDAVPEAFSGSIPLEAHQKAADYTLARLKFARVSIFCRVGLLLAWTIGGGLDWVARQWPAGGLWTDTGFVLVVLLAGEILLLPLSYYETFRIEQRFGFNRTTVPMYWSDFYKQVLIGVLLGGPLIAAALWLAARDLWWQLWAGWVMFTFFITWAFPVFLAPIFWKFEPLEDGALKSRLDALLERTGFRNDGLFRMDGSRRSARANAYFTGIGAKKRIVLYDTLCEQLAPDEIEAVLAHELGHFRLHHVRA
ncbi:MAG: M48 family metallopeptidase, partial [Planctomycetota bacterium]|nr:M48 family metallopeptidase [Planctomycetota bacterium]